MKKFATFFVVCAGLLTTAVPLRAHHGGGATYDLKKQLSLQGVVAEVLWRNPHIAIILDAKDASGKVVQWTIEHSKITTLARQGYGRNTLKAGQQVTGPCSSGR